MQKKILKLFFIFSFSFFISAASAADLTGSAAVNVTSDTAATAKTMAFVEARRQIVTETLSPYANSADFRDLMKNTNDATLANLVSATTIDGERLSATTYSANIKMTIDAVAAKKWMADNDVENWLGESVSVDRSVVVIDLAGGLRDLVELNRALRNENIKPEIKRISGLTLTIGIPASSRAAFINAVRGAGWRVSDTDGFLRVSK